MNISRVSDSLVKDYNVREITTQIVWIVWSMGTSTGNGEI